MRRAGVAAAAGSPRLGPRAPRAALDGGATEAGLDDADVDVPLDGSHAHVFALIHLCRSLVRERIESVMSYDSLRSPSVDIALIRPLVEQLTRVKHFALVYALLLNRLHFQAEAEHRLAYSMLYLTRANACELLCIKVLSSYTAHPTELVGVLTTPYEPFSGAAPESFASDDRPSEAELRRLRDWSAGEAQNALELAIQSDARRLIATPLCQRVLQAIYDGDLTMATGAVGHSLLADDYKCRPVEAYDVRERPLLDHYLLRVPRVRAFLEVFQFVALTALFCLVLRERTLDRVGLTEGLFIVFVFGYALDELAQSFGSGYTSDIFNALDIAFLALFAGWLVVRVVSLVRGDLHLAATSFDLLSCGACILFPRLASSSLRDSIVLLGIQSMFADFARFMLVASICASGFGFALVYLADGQRSTGSIIWLLLRVWFGNSYVAFDEALLFGAYLGPVVMITYAAFSNTLLLTILIAILSADFATIQRDAAESFLFQRAVRTLERVKSEALHQHLAPLNLLAFLILAPASVLLSPRDLHRLNVFLSRAFNAPVLLAVSLLARFRRRHDAGRVRLDDDRWTSYLASLGASRADELAVKPFARAVSDAGRAVPGLELDDETRARHQRARRTLSLAHHDAMLAPPPHAEVDGDVAARLKSLEAGQRELLAALRELLDEPDRAGARGS